MRRAGQRLCVHLRLSMSIEHRTPLPSRRSPDWIDNWSGLERPEYERKKEEVADAIVARLEKVFPGLKEAVILR